jgi:hypothetical protein
MLGYFGALGIQEFGISKNCIWLKGNLKMMIQFGIGSPWTPWTIGKPEAQTFTPREQGRWSGETWCDVDAIQWPGPRRIKEIDGRSKFEMFIYIQRIPSTWYIYIYIYPVYIYIMYIYMFKSFPHPLLIWARKVYPHAWKNLENLSWTSNGIQRTSRHRTSVEPAISRSINMMKSKVTKLPKPKTIMFILWGLYTGFLFCDQSQKPPK